MSVKQDDKNKTAKSQQSKQWFVDYAVAIESVDYCEDGWKFYEWCNDKLLADLGEDEVTGERVSQAIAFLEERYLKYRNLVNKKHTDYSGKNHKCLYHVNIAILEILLDRWLGSSPFPLEAKEPDKPPIEVEVVREMMLGEREP